MPPGAPLSSSPHPLFKVFLSLSFPSLPLSLSLSLRVPFSFNQRLTQVQHGLRQRLLAQAHSVSQCHALPSPSVYIAWRYTNVRQLCSWNAAHKTVFPAVRVHWNDTQMVRWFFFKWNGKQCDCSTNLETDKRKKKTQHVSDVRQTCNTIKVTVQITSLPRDFDSSAEVDKVKTNSDQFN